MKRMIPSSKLTIKNDKLTAMEGIYDSEGNQIIADGGSLVVGNPEVPAGTSPTELSGLSVQNDSTKQFFKITHSPVVEANPVVPEGITPTALSGLKVGSNYYGVGGERPFQSFAPATENSITKAEADEYVRKIASGQLCEYNGSYSTGIILYAPEAEVDGIYLQITFVAVNEDLQLEFIGSLKYTLNSQGTLDVVDM